MRNFGISLRERDDQRGSSEHEREPRPSQGFSGERSSAVGIHSGVNIHASPLSRRPALWDGGRSDTQAGAHGARGRSANLIHLPAAVLSRGVPLKASNPLQASLDVFAISFWLSYFLLWFGSIAFLIWLLFS